MAGITQDLVQLGLDFDDLTTRLGMDGEEIRRFMASAQGQAKDMADALQSTDYSRSINVVHSSELMADPETATQLQRSAGANEASKKFALEMAQRKKLLNEKLQEKVKSLQKSTGQSVSQIQKEQIANELEKSLEMPAKVAVPQLKKFLVMVSSDELKKVDDILEGSWGTGLIAMVELFAENPDWRKLLKKRIAKKERE